MPKMLNDGVLEYEDETPATEAQVSFWNCSAPCMGKEDLSGMHYFICLISAVKIWNPLLFFFFITADGEGCCDIFVLGSRTWDGREETGNNHPWPQAVVFCISNLFILCSGCEWLMSTFHWQMGFKWIFVLSLALLQAAYYRRLKWSIFKSRKLVVDVVNWTLLSRLCGKVWTGITECICWEHVSFMHFKWFRQVMAETMR